MPNKKQLPIRIISKVVRGYGRGSKDLGIPTANLSREKGILSCSCGTFDDLPTGIYWGFARVIGDPPPSSYAASTTTNGGGDDADEDDRDGDFERKRRDGSESSGLGKVFVAAISMGYNPTYGNDERTIEPHLIAPSDHPRRHSSTTGETEFRDFYDDRIILSVVGYLRPELPFEGLEKLTDAIKGDIANSELLARGNDAMTLAEREWVGTASGKERLDG